MRGLMIIDNLVKLKELKLPIYSYKGMIEKIINEIDNRNLFRWQMSDNSLTNVLFNSTII